MKYILETLKRSFPFLLNKGIGIIFVILCLLMMGASCNKENTSDEPSEQIATGSLSESASVTDSTSGQDEARAETSETSPEESEETSTDFDWQELGKTTYNNCQTCHQASGEGIPSAFPPLKGHMAELYNAEGGRKYIINVVLYGLQGKIEVQGASYNSAMIAHNFLSDEQLAAVLNHELNSWGNDEMLEEFSPILPSEVEAERENAFSAKDVLDLRPNLP